MNICVTGATGLIARHIIMRLAMNSENRIAAIITPGRLQFAKELYMNFQNISFVEATADDLKTQLVPLLSDAIVVHTAFTRKNNGTEIAKSLQYAEELFSICKIHKVQGVINFSSRSVYKDPLPGELNTEESIIDLDSLIATAKYGTELLLDNMFCKTNINYTNLRCASVNELKTDNNMTRPLNVFVDCVIQGNPITVFNGNQIMSFIDPRDVAQAVELLCKSQKKWKHVYNIGPNAKNNIKLIEMAHEVVDIGLEYGYKAVDINVIEKDIQQTAGLDIHLFQSDFEYYPQYDLKQMIRGLFEMKRAYLS